MIKSIFSQILDRKRNAVAQLRADPSSRDFRERALEIRKNANPHRLLASAEARTHGDQILSRSSSADRLPLELFATI